MRPLSAALLSRKICYEHLKVAHNYLSHDDLRGWRPEDVVNTLITEVDENATSELTLNISAINGILTFVVQTGSSRAGNL
jgi:hypothetical protein